MKTSFPHLPEPVVSLSEVVQYLPGAVVPVAGQHDAGAAVGVAGHPRAVDGEHHQEHQHGHDHDGPGAQVGRGQKKEG